jgi:hypothetical protein
MKAYGKRRDECANRRIRGTSMACPCCIPGTTWHRSKTRKYKKRERQLARKALYE